MKEVWPYVKDNPDVLTYMPDFDEGKLPERDYLYGVLATIYEEETRELVRNARKVRAVSGKDAEEEMV